MGPCEGHYVKMDSFLDEIEYPVLSMSPTILLGGTVPHCSSPVPLAAQ